MLKVFLKASCLFIILLFQTPLFAQESLMNQSPNYVYKLLTIEQWQAVNEHQLEATYGSDLDQRDGYLHLSLNSQVPAIANKYFADLTDGKLFKIDYNVIESSVKWEPNSKGQMFPHVYGVIPKEAIVDTFDFNTSSFDFSQLD